MTTKIVNAGSDSSKKWSKDEQKLIETIIECQNITTTKADRIGECCNELIKLNNGIQYGDKTLKRIANSPGINCSEFHLRRCWNFYRLMNNKDYQNEDLKALSITPSVIYQLARIFNSKWLSEETKICLVKEIAKKAVIENMSVDHLVVWVSLKLKIEEERMGKKEEKSKNSEKSPKTPDTIINEKRLQNFADRISRIVRSKTLFHEVIEENHAVRRGFFNLMNENLSLLEKIAACCKDEATSKNISALLSKWSVVAEKINKSGQKVA